MISDKKEAITELLIDTLEVYQVNHSRVRECIEVFIEDLFRPLDMPPEKPLAAVTNEVGTQTEPVKNCCCLSQ